MDLCRGLRLTRFRLNPANPTRQKCRVIRLYDLVLVPNHEAGNSYWRNVELREAAFMHRIRKLRWWFVPLLACAPGKTEPTASPSAPTIRFHRALVCGSRELQVPPLRYASVGMTRGRAVLPFGSVCWIEKTVGPFSTFRFGRSLRHNFSRPCGTREKFSAAC